MHTCVGSVGKLVLSLGIFFFSLNYVTWYEICETLGVIPVNGVLTSTRSFTGGALAEDLGASSYRGK